jgi:hypothetical protein
MKGRVSQDEDVASGGLFTECSHMSHTSTGGSRRAFAAHKTRPAYTTLWEDREENRRLDVLVEWRNARHNLGVVLELIGYGSDDCIRAVNVCLV